MRRCAWPKLPTRRAAGGRRHWFSGMFTDLRSRVPSRGCWAYAKPRLCTNLRPVPADIQCARRRVHEARDRRRRDMMTCVVDVMRRWSVLRSSRALLNWNRTAYCRWRGGLKRQALYDMPEGTASVQYEVEASRAFGSRASVTQQGDERRLANAGNQPHGVRDQNRPHGAEEYPGNSNVCSWTNTAMQLIKPSVRLQMVTENMFSDICPTRRVTNHGLARHALASVARW